MIEIKQTKEFKDWLVTLTAKEQLQVVARLERIKNFGHKNGQKKDIEKARLLVRRYTGN